MEKNVTLPKGKRLMFESNLKEQRVSSIKIKKLMKTTFYITVMIFGLQSSLLFANGTSAQAIYPDHMSYMVYDIGNEVADEPAISLDELKVLAPVNPMEADFSDNDLIPLSSPAQSTLAPVTPGEADFNDSDADILNALVLDLAPKTPDEADFLDADTATVWKAGKLAPVVPEEATFEDL